MHTGRFSPIALVERQLQAYNARDLAAFLECFADDIRVEDAFGHLTVTGKAHMSRIYEALFASSPTLHAEIAHRTSVDSFVFDDEQISGAVVQGRVTSMRAMVVYRAEHDAIAWMRVFSDCASDQK